MFRAGGELEDFLRDGAGEFAPPVGWANVLRRFTETFAGGEPSREVLAVAQYQQVLVDMRLSGPFARLDRYPTRGPGS